MASERELALSIELMRHTSGTKKYALLTVVDSNTMTAVGLLLWGPSDRFSGHKFIKGSVQSVSSDMGVKRTEKKKGDKSGKYTNDSAPEIMSAGASAVLARVQSFLLAEGVDGRTSKEWSGQTLHEIGLAFQARSQEEEAEELALEQARKAKEAAKKAEIEATRDAAYQGSWGAW